MVNLYIDVNVVTCDMTNIFLLPYMQICFNIGYEKDYFEFDIYVISRHEYG